mmetsp:Transcript_16332/g.39169  ORF Transcript_16332/g.39169 Transcript_16332/m.39169 type:complete len:207 (-) Transcript_16332:157-777(-)
MRHRDSPSGGLRVGHRGVHAQRSQAGGSRSSKARQHPGRGGRRGARRSAAQSGHVWLPRRRQRRAVLDRRRHLRLPLLLCLPLLLPPTQTPLLRLEFRPTSLFRCFRSRVRRAGWAEGGSSLAEGSSVQTRRERARREGHGHACPGSSPGQLPQPCHGRPVQGLASGTSRRERRQRGPSGARGSASCNPGCLVRNRLCVCGARGEG